MRDTTPNPKRQCSPQDDVKKRVLVSWSSGKDSAWMMYQLQQRPDIEIIALHTSFNQTVERVTMHAVTRELVSQQARRMKLPVWPLELPFPCTNEIFEDRFTAICEQAMREKITHFCFGDLYLSDVREYRVNLLMETGLEPLFPIWCGGMGKQTGKIAREMIAAGFRSIVTCVDPQQVSPKLLGREFDAEFLRDLPEHVDPCGERGEFHTFCFEGPIYPEPIPIQRGRKVHRDGFDFLDLKFPND